MTAVEAELMIGEAPASDVPLALFEKREFMKLSIEERRRLLESQADRIAKDYGASLGDEPLGAGDFAEEY